MNNRNLNHISLDVIAGKIYKNPILKDLNYEDIIDHALSVIKIAKVPGIYHEEGCFIDSVNHKAAIPKNALNIKSVDLCVNKSLIPMVIATESTFQQIDKTSKFRPTDNSNVSNRYALGNSIITTEAVNCKLFIRFDTITIDENGIPTVPDSEALIRAIEAYIKVQVYTVLFDLGKINERSLVRAEQEYYFNIGKAQTEFQEFQNEDHMEAFLNGFTAYFPTQNDHSNRYANKGYKRNLKRL